MNDSCGLLLLPDIRIIRLVYVVLWFP
jgi:hypothetical protein